MKNCSTLFSIDFKLANDKICIKVILNTFESRAVLSEVLMLRKKKIDESMRMRAFFHNEE